MKKRLGDILIEAGLIDESQLSAGLGEQGQWGGKLGTALINKGFISEADLVRALASQMGSDFISIKEEGLQPVAVNALKADAAKEHGVMPFKLEKETLTIATSDPTDIQSMDTLEFMTGKKVKPVLAVPEEISLAIRKYYDNEDISDSDFERVLTLTRKKKEIPGVVVAESPPPRKPQSVAGTPQKPRKGAFLVEKTLASLIKLLVRKGYITTK